MKTAIKPERTAEIVNLLQDPATYPDRPTRVETIETHISWVFLTDGHVYKLKKPVRFEFLDFSTPAARRLACEEEIHLNRRLSHDVYMGVIPITLSDERGLQLGGGGREIDCVVKMRRLPADRALDVMIRRRQLHSAQIDAVSDYLARFYTSLPSKVLQPEDHHRHLVDHCLANRTDLLGHLRAAKERRTRRIHAAQQRFLTLKRELFHDRVENGRIVDGHGDLRAEHVYLESPPSVIDCVEFSPELREVDVVDELSFLAMDCQRLGNGDVGRRLLDAYQQASGDVPPDNLAAFYKSYRACVRAKVAALRAEQASGAQQRQFVRQACQYLTWAEHFAAELGPPLLVIVGGLMGSGKSTLAAALAESLAAELRRTDQIRNELFGSSDLPADYGVGLYDHATRRHVYDVLLTQAEDLLDEGCSLVLDGTFLTNELRWTAVDLATRHGARCLLVQCECPRETALARIARRAESEYTDSEARPDLYDQQRGDYEPPDPILPTIAVDATRPVEEELRMVVPALRAALFAR